MSKLLILSREAQQYAALVGAAALDDLEISLVLDDAASLREAASRAADCDIILGDPPLVVEALPIAASLRWVQSTWAGIDSLCGRGLRRDYVLTAARGVFGPQISEYVMTYVFALERRIFEMHADQQKRHWRPRFYRPASEICMGIVGLGTIGRHLARVAGGFGLRLKGLNRSGRTVPEVGEVHTAESMARFLGELDYVVVTLPGTEQTRHFIDAEALGLMKPTAVLINVGRGQVVDQGDLAGALERGDIGGAVLDVFEDEPLPAESPLWRMPNTWITPHTAGISFPADISGIFAGNYHRFRRGEPLEHRVDFKLGY